MSGLMVVLFGTACERRTPIQGSGSSSAPTHAAMTVYRATLYQQVAQAEAAKLAEGRVWLGAALPGGNFEGEWELSLAQKGDGSAYARLQGSGPLNGRTTETGMVIDLHPGTVDNNVELLLSRNDGGTIRGTWQLVTDAGVEARGPIELVASPK